MDLRAFLTWAPASAAFSRSFHGEEATAWADPSVHLLAAVVDLLQGANWQRSGGKGSKPKPVTRPGDKQQLGGRKLTAMDIDSLDAFLGWSPREQ